MFLICVHDPCLPSCCIVPHHQASETSAADTSALQAAVEALKEEEAAAAEMAEAQAALQQLQEDPCQLEVPQLEQRLAELLQQRQQLEEALTDTGSSGGGRCASRRYVLMPA